MREGWLERSGVRLHYVEWTTEGEAREPALFLLHGLSSNALVWKRVAERLPGRRIVALDQRSHGPSDRPPEGYEPALLLEDAAHAIRELELGRPLVAGHSWGASVGLELAARYPELACGLVFVDGPVAAMTRFMSWEEAASRMQPPFPVYVDLEQAAQAQRDYLGDAWDDDLRDFVRAGLTEVEGGLASTLSVPARRRILEHMYSFEPLDFFPLVQGPLLLALASELWPGAPQEFIERRRRSAEEIVAGRPDAQLRWYDSRHDIPLIRPDELATDLEKTAIAAAFAALAQEVAGLQGDWSRPAQSDDGGWAAKDLLAHLSSTQAGQLSVVASAATVPAGSDGTPREPFDSDRWNASQIRRRRERSAQDLVAEMRTASAELYPALLAADLAQPPQTGPFAGQPLTEVMDEMLQHQRGHLAELRRALAAG